MALINDFEGPLISRKARLFAYSQSSIGLKTIMAVTGLILWAYLIAHIGGNLQMFAGRAVFNSYAAFLQGTAALLWTERIVVFGSILVHAWAAIKLTQLNKAARPVDYVGRSTETSTLMSRTMIVSGAVVLAFFVFHILHFTVQNVGGARFEAEALPAGGSRPDAYLMVYSAFKIPAIVAVYVVGQILLFAHLLHGTTSLFQSLGLYRPFRNVTARRVSRTLALVIFVAAIALPLVIYFAWPAL